MERRAAIRTLLMAGAVSIARRRGFAQTQEQPGFTLRSDVRLVLLNVSVKDSTGKIVPGLAKSDFKLFENGQPQPIAVFAREDLPVTVGILVDESGSMRHKRGEVLAAAQTLIAEGNPNDENFILNFNDTVQRGLPEGQPFSSDAQALRTALYRGRPEGRTALFDAVFEGLNQLELGSRDKKALVLISDGGDNASKHDRRDVYRKIDRSMATIYAVGLYDEDEAERSPSLLRHLAGVSGGEAFFPANPADMTAICRGIAKDIRARYTLGYAPPATNGGALRRIRVSVAAPARGRLIARARTEYQYEELPAQVSR